MSDAPAYTWRNRAESFGTAAENYDRYRPSYPPALFDRIEAAVSGRRALDVGCGTGKAAVLLRDRGFDVLGVEFDDRMADVARGHGIPVETAAFEEWDPSGRTFDLITSAQAWHWIDPVVGSAKAAALLHPEGALAIFWNVGDVPAHVRAVLDELYNRIAPEIAHQIHEPPAAHARHTTAAHGAQASFGTVETFELTWSDTYTPAEYAGLLGTHSDHLTMTPERRAEVLGAAADTLATAVPDGFEVPYVLRVALATHPRP